MPLFLYCLKKPFLALCSCICFLFIFVSSAQGQTFWAKTQAGGNVDETLGVTGDGAGNSYATGYFSTSASISGNTLSVNGLTDIFVTKIGTAGNTLWSVKAGGPSSDRGLGIATDNAGNVFVCGFFTNTADFGNGVTLTANAGSQDAFVAKYDSDGNALWARAGGSTGSSDRANAVTTDGSGHVIITGQYTGEATFGALSLTGTGTTNDVFVVKYSPDGDELWARSGNGNALNRGLGIAADNSGAVYACGAFSGDITFENLYSNTILNALFVVKYNADGSEAWMRYAGGSAQSIAYDITTNGTNVYLTGDCGESLTFVNAPGNPTLNTGYSNAVFIAALNGSGGYLWGSSQGSSSPVSARGISHHNGQLGVAGWYECTFESLSEEYGEATFNNIGFRDAFVMRYSTAGDWLWARNFGSQTAEVASDIHVLPDNLEVVCGTFSGEMIIPIQNAFSGNGMTPETNHPNAGLTYCGDSHYGEFSSFEGSASEDGFLIKAIDLTRAPYDYYSRVGFADCDLSIPEPCIGYSVAGGGFNCEEEVEGCPGFGVFSTNYTALGYGYTVQWNNGSTTQGTNVLTTGPITVTYTSLDGCYEVTETIPAEVYENPPTPIITDDLGINTGNISTFPIPICPGDEVELTGTSDFEGTWLGPSGVTIPNNDQPVIVVTQPGTYQYVVTNEEGCFSQNSVLVIVPPPPPPLIQPYLDFLIASDTLQICEGQGFQLSLLDSISAGLVPTTGFSFTWTITPDGSINGLNSPTAAIDEEGWYTISVLIEGLENECEEEEAEYFVSDSLYITIAPVPSVAVDVNAPVAICPNDSLWVVVNSSTGSFTAEPSSLVVQGDSVLIVGPGEYSVSVSDENEFGCISSATVGFELVEVETPAIFSQPNPAIICPGETVQLGTNAIGNLSWQGPSGLAGTSQFITVDEAGLYFLEVEFYDGCGLVSNTLQVAEYATPFISASNAAICPGDSVEIEVISTAGGSIEWLPPLSGSAPSQVISTPGSYGVMVSACGITTEATITVEQVNTEMVIGASDEPLCAGDSVLVSATPDLESYGWLGVDAGDTSQVWVFSSGALQAAGIDTFGCALLSNVIQINFEPLPPPPSFTFEPPCEGDSLVVSVADGFAVAWLDGIGGAPFFDGLSITVPSLVSDTAFYVQLSTANCEGPIDSVAISPKPYPEAPIPATDAPVCTGTTFTLSVLNAEPGVVYTWLPPTGLPSAGAEVGFFASTLANAGTYLVTANLEGCARDTAAIEVDLIQATPVELPPDTAICMQSGFVIGPDTLFASYLWQDGSADSVYVPDDSGLFTLTATDFNGCQTSDQIDLEMVDCQVIVPNIFTPNGDGNNDLWLISVAEPRSLRMVVYNRWGRTVYESDEVGAWWDGNNFRNGEPCPDGVYFYIVELTTFDNLPFGASGTVTLMRDQR